MSRSGKLTRGRLRKLLGPGYPKGFPSFRELCKMLGVEGKGKTPKKRRG